MHSYWATTGVFGLIGIAAILGQPSVERFVAAPPCDGPGVDPWVGELRDRMTAYSGLAHFALGHYGAPTGCEGAVTSDFDGAKFGSVRLSYPEGVTLEVETMPPETSIVTLSRSSGFDDEPLIVDAVRMYAAEIGLRIDWEAPEESTEGDRLVRTFWDPDPGLNASASLVFSQGTLVAVRVSMAL